jgi:hypothetical protein
MYRGERRQGKSTANTPVNASIRLLYYAAASAAETVDDDRAGGLGMMVTDRD